MKLIWKDEWRFAIKYISERKDKRAVSWIQYIFLSILFFKENWISLPFLNFIFKLQKSIEEFYSLWQSCHGYSFTKYFEGAHFKQIYFCNGSLSHEWPGANMMLNITWRMTKLFEPGQEILFLVELPVNNGKMKLTFWKSQPADSQKRRRRQITCSLDAQTEVKTSNSTTFTNGTRQFFIINSHSDGWPCLSEHRVGGGKTIEEKHPRNDLQLNKTGNPLIWNCPVIRSWVEQKKDFYFMCYFSSPVYNNLIPF